MRVLGSLGLIFIIAMSACGTPPSTPPGLIPVTACYSSLSGTQSVAPYAFEQGLFTKHGLDVELVYIDSGSTAATALIAGDVDVCQMAGTAAINAAAAGAPVKVIAGLFNTYVYSLMVAPDIQTPEDLVGKAVAISQPGSASDLAVRVALRSLGLEPDDEVAVLAIGGQSERLAALLAGSVSGTLVSVPETAKAREMGFHELLDMSTLNTPYQHTTVSARQDFIDDHRDAALRFLKAMAEAATRMKSDREGTVAVVAEYMLLDPVADRAALDETYDILMRKYLQGVPYPTLPGIQAVLDELAAEDPSAADVRPEQVVDLTLLTELEETGFFRDLPPTPASP